jgi:hypothetical protein
MNSEEDGKPYNQPARHAGDAPKNALSLEKRIALIKPHPLHV